MSDSPIDIAETFVAHWNANRVEQALAMLSEDVAPEMKSPAA